MTDAKKEAIEKITAAALATGGTVISRRDDVQMSNGKGYTILDCHVIDRGKKCHVSVEIDDTGKFKRTMLGVIA